MNIVGFLQYKLEQHWEQYKIQNGSVPLAFSVFNNRQILKSESNRLTGTILCTLVPVQSSFCFSIQALLTRVHIFKVRPTAGKAFKQLSWKYKKALITSVHRALSFFTTSPRVHLAGLAGSLKLCMTTTAFSKVNNKPFLRWKVSSSEWLHLSGGGGVTCVILVFSRWFTMDFSSMVILPLHFITGTYRGLLTVTWDMTPFHCVNFINSSQV